ncbi:YaiO family outer membrane beta-barrel protein [Tsuneonella sp. HG222]
MMKATLAAASMLAPILIAATTNAQAQSSVRTSVESKDFSRDFGSVRSATIEYKAVLPDTAIVVTPTYGERSAPGQKDVAIGGRVAVYHDWLDGISTRTVAFVAEDAPVFANLDLAQDLTVKVLDNTTVTVGGRWARHFGDREVTFLSAGARQYFKRGSVAYRLSRVNPESGQAFFSHLFNLSVNDARGKGKTQLWLGAGAASLERAPLETDFTGDDLSVLIQRVQPVSKNIALIGGAGISSYDRPATRIIATTVSLGVQLGL